jgi:hypothetical protein
MTTTLKSGWQERLQNLLEEIRASDPADLPEQEFWPKIDETIEALRREWHRRTMAALATRIRDRVPADLTDDEIDQDIEEVIAEAKAERRARRS